VRIATMIISLILMLVVGAQSCAVSLGDAALETKAAEQGGPIGLFMAFLFLIGGAFALACPFVSVLAFFFAGIIGLAGGASTSFSDSSRIGGENGRATAERTPTSTYATTQATLVALMRCAASLRLPIASSRTVSSSAMTRVYG
jgi:hypothetical protein